MSASERRKLVDPDDPDLSITEQARLLGLNRTTLYYKPTPPSERDLDIRLCIDKTYTAHPEFGARRVCVWLDSHYGLRISRKTATRHMREMGIEAVYPRQDTSRPSPQSKVYPYLLGGMDIDHPDHVWSIDITYIPIRRSWLYLAAIIDWFSRYVVSWEMSDSLEIQFVLDACRGALAHSRPEIMNSDQGSHFTSPQYVGMFLDAGSRISMDHRGRAYDNIFIERLWRSLKYENVYPMEYGCPRDAREGISRYLTYYNQERPHQSLGYRTPESVYREGVA